MTKRTKAEWETLVAEYKTSNKTQNKWCKEKGIKPSTFRYHIGNLDKKTGEKKKNINTVKISKKEEVKWSTVKTLEKPMTQRIDGIQIQVNGYTIIVQPEFHIETFTEVCKVLVSL